jgi:hypothetical protein
MSSIYLVAALGIIADIPPPPFSHRGHPIENLVFFLIFFAICAVAFRGLRKLFRSRPKNSVPKPEDVAKE